MKSYDLLRTLCAVPAPSGDERRMKEFLLDHIVKAKSSWKHLPEVIFGEDFQDCIILVFGKPRTAVFAHMDSIGFTVRYDNELVRIGAPHVQSGMKLVGADSGGSVEGSIEVDDDRKITLLTTRTVDRGTNLTFKQDWRETEKHVQSCYLDNRLGVFVALECCKTLENGVIVFSCWEEHGGGSVPFLAKYIYERFSIRQALISDVTWVTDGVPSGGGTVISMRDSGLPRRSFVERIIEIAKTSGADFQLEVESAGGSDGTELQKQPYPINWCFIGPPEEHVHTPDEKVAKTDIEATIRLYEVLLERL